MNFNGNDLELKHINKTDNGKVICISFSSWSYEGNGLAFGFNFFKKNNIEAFFISQKNGNHWWHTTEINDIAKIVHKRSLETKKKILLYGSSMGGYASCHLRNLFGADLAIAIAPQIFIDKNVLPDELRWQNDISNIQHRLIFDEIANINLQNGDLFIFYDPFHKQDASHIMRLIGSINSFKQLHLIEVPYANHDVARLMTATKIMQKTLFSIENTGYADYSVIDDCHYAYLNDHKSFFNYFRKIALVEKDILPELLDKFNLFIKLDNMDFEALYMLAECFVVLGDGDSALSKIDKSINLYKIKFFREPPNYLYLKRDYILKKFKL